MGIFGEGVSGVFGYVGIEGVSMGFDLPGVLGNDGNTILGIPGVIPLLVCGIEGMPPLNRE